MATRLADPHALALATSLAYHREIAARIARDPSIAERARGRVAAWNDDVHVFYRDAWAAALAAPVDELCALLVEDSERARDLRQSTPFAGALDNATRWRIWRQARGR